MVRTKGWRVAAALTAIVAVGGCAQGCDRGKQAKKSPEPAAVAEPRAAETPREAPVMETGPTAAELEAEARREDEEGRREEADERAPVSGREVPGSDPFLEEAPDIERDIPADLPEGEDAPVDMPPEEEMRLGLHRDPSRRAAERADIVDPPALDAGPEAPDGERLPREEPESDAGMPVIPEDGDGSRDAAVNPRDKTEDEEDDSPRGDGDDDATDGDDGT